MSLNVTVILDSSINTNEAWRPECSEKTRRAKHHALFADNGLVVPLILCRCWESAADRIRYVGSGLSFWQREIQRLSSLTSVFGRSY